MPERDANQLAADVRANTHRLRDMIGFALAEKNIPRAPTWTLLAPQALDNIDADADALVARITDLEAQNRVMKRAAYDLADRLQAAKDEARAWERKWRELREAR